MSLQDKLAAIAWPADIERVGAYHVYRGKYYGTLDDGQSAETAYQTDRATAARDLLALCEEWIATAPHVADCAWRGTVERAYDPPCGCGRDALLTTLAGALDRE